MKRSQLFLSSIGDDAAETAHAFGLALELAQFCTAVNLDDESFIRPSLDECLAAAPCRVLHAPFADLCPAAIDPLVRSATELRLRQTVERARTLGIRKIVVHAGFIPHVHFPEWFTAGSIGFWRDFLRGVPADMTICLENVMEPTPEMLCEIVRTVDDPRLRLCLDLGHANTEISDYPVMRWLADSAPLVSHLHVHNNCGGSDLHLPLFEGEIDYLPVFSALADLAPNATVTLELRQSRESVEWLMKHQIFEDTL